ncbi:gliding motility-associated protein GldE [Blattabacterium cuenoti]|uniref:gliding motility-associated protein GldE n=1 Tax=Blattabacterium cuenoti TaxID=1653831 RepID=UPI00293B9D13|nr:gliding motility-associated protein GldE [Blattabacterium cuenoti]
MSFYKKTSFSHKIHEIFHKKFNILEKEYSTNFILKSVFYLFLYFTLIIILLLFSALVSGSETAFFCLDKKTIDQKTKKNRKKKHILLKILKYRKKLLAIILIANNFFNVGIVILTSSLLEEFFQKDKFSKTINISFSLLLEIISITFILLLFGEIIPKIYAEKNNFRFSIFMAKPLFFISKILEPISKIMISFSELLENKIIKKNNIISIDQLSKALKITSYNQKNNKEIKFLQKIVDFGNTEIHQIMTPRIDMFAISINTNFSDVIRLVRYQEYSRIPIYNNSIDDIEGVLFAKDLLPFIYHNKKFSWKILIHPPFFVPQKKKIDNLLNDFKIRKIHLAIVVDEYGGTCGLVTLEDVVEEIVGDITDEFDKEYLNYSKVNKNTYFFDGKTALINFYRIMEIDDEIFFENEKGEADTLGGFIMEICKEFPKEKQKIDFFRYSFVIQSIDHKRIKTIKVIRNEKK